LWCGALVALTGCTTYVEHRPVRTVYVPPRVEPVPVVVMPEESPVVVIQTENDFYEPLIPHGEWVMVGSYGRCWRPTRVEAGWRPYADGHWQRTDAGWYWASDEPWGWATYHYGRWDWSVEFGWIWVPHTQWAPAWVSWRQGAGYVGWAPLPPSASIGARGIVEVHETALAPRAFVFVSEQRLLEPVRPATVIVNNTTIINQTVNITKIQVVNKTVINEGPRPEVIERKSGRKVEAVPVRELRRKEENEMATRRRNIPPGNAATVQTPARTEVAPVRTIPGRERSQVANPADAGTAQQPSRNELRKPVEQRPTQNSARPELAIPTRNQARPELKAEQPRIETAPAGAGARGRQEAKPTVLPRETRPQSEAIPQRQLPARNNGLSGANEVKPGGPPARPEPARDLGNARQRSLERGKIRPETEPSAAAGKPTQPPTGRQATKPATPAKEKPGARKRGEAKQKPGDQKKGEERETPRPAAPPQSPP
jgi:hypothetical protein